jgi:hypothetical protein
VSEYPLIKETDRASSLSSASIRVNRLQGHTLFTRSFNSHSNAVDFGSLFVNQGAVLVNLGRSSGLRDEQRRLLGTMLIRFLDVASTRKKGQRPVIMAIDEAAFLLPFVVDSVREIANMARQRNIRLLIAIQYPGDIPLALQGSLKTNTQVKAFFRDSGDYASTTAAYIKSQVPEIKMPTLPLPVTVRRMALTARRWDIASHNFLPLVADYDGDIEDAPPAIPVIVPPSNMDEAIRKFVSWADRYEKPLRLDNGEYFKDICAKMPPGSVRLRWERVGNEYHGFALFDPPEPPQKPGSEYWLNRLRSLNAGQAIVFVGSGEPVECRITQVNPWGDAHATYVEKSEGRFKHVPKPFVPPQSLPKADDTVRKPPAQPAAKPERRPLPDPPEKPMEVANWPERRSRHENRSVE